MFKIDLRGGVLIKVKVNLLACGTCKAPVNWLTQDIPTPYRLYYVRGGCAYFRTGTTEVLLKKNHFYLFPSTLPFIIRQDPNDRLDHLFYNFIMTPSAVSASFICASIDEHPLFQSFLHIMNRTVSDFKVSPIQQNKDIAAKALESFLTLFLSLYPVSQVQSNDITDSIRYIEKNYMNDITVREIARHLFLSEDYFIRKFKKAFGITPHVYLSRLRLSVAKELISAGSSLQAAADMTGFRYASSLSHALKKSRG